MAFLDTLLSTSIDGRPFTTQELYEEVSTFIFEVSLRYSLHKISFEITILFLKGHDTTSSAICFTTFLLSRHLGVQKKVFEEQQAIMGQDLKRSATFQEMAEMKYLDLVVKEALRLFPSVPNIARHTEKEYNMSKYPTLSTRKKNFY